MSKIIYVIVPVLVFLTAWLGGKLTSQGQTWYQSINLPSWTPAGSIIGTVWTIIFILLIIAGWLLLKQNISGDRFNWLALVFVLNLILNLAWSFFFFYLHNTGAAVWEAAILDLSIIALIVLAWPFSKIAAGLLLPYALWVTFATYLTYSVWLLNM